jgi:phosphate-selective porin OprO/OprP
MKKILVVWVGLMLAQSVAWAGTPWVTGVKSAEGDDVKFVAGGRMELDYNWADEELWADEEGTEFRRARMDMAGTLFERVDFKLQIELATLSTKSTTETITYQDANGDSQKKSVVTKESGNVELRDAFMALRDTPVGTVFLGNKDVYLSTEEFGSSKYVTFCERALPAASAVIDPEREMSLQVINDKLMDERLAYIACVYRDSYNGWSKGSDTTGVGGRVGVLPVKSAEAAVLVNAAGYVQDVTKVTYKFRPEIHMAPAQVAGEMAADGTTLYTLGSYGTWGPAHAGAEYIGSSVQADGEGEDADVGGYYVQVGWLLTGEHRDLTNMEWKRIVPKSNFGKGWGAWEIKARYSTIDLNDGSLDGAGVEDNIATGINWYLNAYARILMDVVFADIHDVADQEDVDGVGGVVRFACDF